MRSGVMILDDPLYFDAQVKSSYAYNDVVYKTSPAWQLMRMLYLNNYCKPQVRYSTIPKKIHQIWLGSSFPKRYWKFAESWQKFHPDWEYRFWTDRDIESIEITKRDVLNKCINPGMRSDILRYEILRQIGGLYVDTDFECLKPFDDLMYLDFFTSVSYDTELQLYIGLIASAPNHQIVQNCCDMILPYYGNKGSVIINCTGANLFTNAFLKYTKKDSRGIVAFPTDFFYPLPNSLRPDKNESINPYDYVKPCSYAIHHWAVSWIKTKIK